MLSEPDRLSVLQRLLTYVRPDGYVLIADERSNISGFEAVIDDDSGKWRTTYKHRGYLFIQRSQEG